MTDERPAAGCLHELFERQADRTPDSVAVICDDEKLTYRELEQRANRLAHRLRRQGMGREDVVGLCLERSLDLVVAMLGVLKAGAAYLPVDPLLTPADRAAFVFADAGARLVVTRQGLAEGLDAPAVICMDQDEPRPADEPVGRCAGDALPGSLAYLIYTSGSTGVPKGVMVTHEAIVNQVGWITTELLAGHPVRFLQGVSAAFDAAMIDLYAPLASGGAVVMAPPDLTAAGLELRDLLIAHRVEAVNLTPQVVSTLLETGQFDGTAMRWILTGGEVLRDELVLRCREMLPGVAFHNVYGPTEATVNATSYAADRPVDGPSVPIGEPITNVRTYVVDEELRRVAPGGRGELLIGGTGLARGYAGRPALTAERFVPDPFSGETGARLYRTGDLVHLRADGAIEYEGRLDRQVKIRGYRIELGEIEHALTRLPYIDEAAVVAHGDAGTARLIAHVTTDGTPVRAEEIRTALAGRLPAYMIPATVVTLDAMPRHPGIGKIDRDRLPAPGAAPDRPADGTRTGFADPAHERPAALVAELLDLEDIGPDDDFFALGGHSLLAMRLAARIRSEFGAEITPRTVLETPRVGDLAALVHSAVTASTNPVLPRTGTGPVPLTANQERLWFLDQLQPESPAYRLPLTIRLRGELDPEALSTALSGIVARHEALRTVFPAVDGTAHQVVTAPAPVPLPVEDVPELDEAELRRRVDAAVLVPIDLAEGPLLRAQLLRAGAAEHVLLLTVHHIVFDSWSVRILVQELAHLYAGGAALPALPVQCADHALWEADRQGSAQVAAQLDHWRERLAGVPPLLDLPTDRPRPAEPGFHGRDEEFVLPPELVGRLREICRSEGLTLFMVLLAGFELLLARYTGQNDLVVGTPVAHRSRSELDPLIGFYVNTLVLRADLTGSPTARSFLARVKEGCLDAYENQDVPFDRLVEELQPERDLGRSPLFQVMFDFESFPASSAQGGGLTLDVLDIRPRTARFDLTLDIKEEGDEVRGALNYSTDLFDAATARRMAGHYVRLLTALADDIDVPLPELDMLGTAEREQLLVEWNAEDLGLSEEKCVHELFEEQADRTPEAVAVVCGADTLTFRELEERANRVAGRLIGLGTGPETVVALCLERSVEMIVGLLAVLKAGGAYLPLDPSLPTDRLSFMLKDAKATAVLTQARHEGRFAGHCPELRLDADEHFTAYPPTRPAPRGTPDRLLYVIYTSGSTGTPKGVAMGHRAQTRMFRALGTLLGRDGEPPRRVTMNAPVFFDGSVQQLGWMFRGATLVIVPDEVREDPDRFVELLAREHIDILDCTPSHAELLVLADGLARVPHPMRVIVAGEAVSESLWRSLAAGPWRAYNVYGPTETNNVTGRPVTGDGPPTIGRPLAGCPVYVVDEALRPVPVGVAGELLLGGQALARGYLARPGQTAEKFVPDTLSGAVGGRLYRTGDQVRRLPDGELLFLGRGDHQVKLRGFRVELGEVQAALARLPGVTGCAVLVREDVPGDKRLVGYCTPADAASSEEDLLRELHTWLPDYMVPSALVALDALPLTVNGKVDNRALPAPADTGTGAAAGGPPPGDALEELLVTLWTEVLSPARPVGTRDSFFVLGGHSLLAARLLVRINRLLAVTLPLRALYSDPTPSGVASALEELAPRGYLKGRAAAALEILRMSDEEVRLLLTTE
ncbi:amino acid adenylation domain-containing protein [Streptomyces sp. NPDC057592]|uniref:amino acid adenylation domain-containing protein n=1 Tax=unclassified Streptomyces TaxID=2593676 RepID=UPI00369D19AA